MFDKQPIVFGDGDVVLPQLAFSRFCQDMLETTISNNQFKKLVRSVLFTLDNTIGSINGFALPSAALTVLPAWPTLANKLTSPVAYAGLATEVIGLTDALLTRYDSQYLKTLRDLFNNLGVNTPMAALFAFLTIVAVYCDIVGVLACDNVSDLTVEGLASGALLFAVLQAIQGIIKMDALTSFRNRFDYDAIKKSGAGISSILNSIQNSALLVSLAQIGEALVGFDNPSNTYKLIRYSSAIVLGSGLTYGQTTLPENSNSLQWLNRIMGILAAFTIFWQVYTYPWLLPTSLVLPVAASILVLALKGLPQNGETPARVIIVSEKDVEKSVAPADDKTEAINEDPSEQDALLLHRPSSSSSSKIFTQCFPCLTFSRSANQNKAAEPARLNDSQSKSSPCTIF